MVTAAANRGLFFQHAGDGSAVWLGSDIVIERSAGGGPDTYDLSTQFPSGRASAYEVGVDMLAWLEDAGRPWSGSGATFLFQPSSPSPDRLGVQWIASETYKWNASADLGPLLGVPTVPILGDTIFDTVVTGGCLASINADFAVRNWARRVEGQGPSSRSGAWHPDSQTSALRRPTSVDVILDEQQAWALADAQRFATSPRSGTVFHNAQEVWRPVQIGRIPPLGRGQIDLYRQTFEVTG